MDIDQQDEHFFTKCNPCVFCETDNEKQSGCQLGRLDKFHQQKKTTLNDDGFFTIKSICNTCRGNVWAQQNHNFNLITKVQNEIRISLDFILLCIDHEPEKIMDNIATSVTQCVNQKQIKPHRIIIVVKSKSVNYSELFEMLKELCGNIDFYIVRVVDYEKDIHTYLEMGVQKSRSRYYAVFNIAERIPLNLILMLNTIINNQLKSLSMVQPYQEYNGLILQRMLHNIFGGSRIMPIYQKIEEAAEMQNSQANIYTWEELWKTPE